MLKEGGNCGIDGLPHSTCQKLPLHGFAGDHVRRKKRHITGSVFPRKVYVRTGVARRDYIMVGFYKNIENLTAMPKRMMMHNDSGNITLGVEIVVGREQTGVKIKTPIKVEPQDVVAQSASKRKCHHLRSMRCKWAYQNCEALHYQINAKTRDGIWQHRGQKQSIPHILIGTSVPQV